MALARLSYYLHDDPATFRLELVGALAANNTAELERCWRTGSSTLGTRNFVVDLEALTSVDDAGRRLLVRWQQLGARFLAESEGARSILELIAESTGVREMAAS